MPWINEQFPSKTKHLDILLFLKVIGDGGRDTFADNNSTHVYARATAIPPEILNALNWKVGNVVELYADEQKVVLKKV